MCSVQDPVEVLERAVRSERARLAAIARREGLAPEDAFDAVHDAFSTFLQLAIRGELPERREEHAPLLAGIVRNMARNKRRRHHLARRHHALDAVDAAGDAHLGAHDDDASPSALVARAEEHVRLRACVDALCDTQRAVVTMRVLEEQPGEDVAAALGISRGYVDVLLHRAKASLLACMTDGE